MHGTDEKKWGKGKWIAVGCGGCGLLVALLAAFVAGIMGIVITSMKSSDAYKIAFEQACQHPGVVENLGEPIEAGLWTNGSVNISGPSGTASLAIPISGPKNKATVYVEAEKEAGEWHFHVLEVAIAGRSERIDLLVDPELSESATPAISA